MLSSKLPAHLEPASTIMAAKAQCSGALDFTHGCSHFGLTTDLMALATKYFKPNYLTYAPAAGVMPLREQLAELIGHTLGISYNPEKEITITAGATQAISTAITAFVKENDEVIVIEPSYVSYTPLIKMNGGIPVYIQLNPPDFAFDWEELTRSVTSRTKMIILNNPHNPTGRVFTADEMKKLGKLVNGSKIIVLSDEVFHHLSFRQPFTSAGRIPELAPRSLVVSSLGKTFCSNGLRIGYCLGPDDLMKEFYRFHRLVVDAVNTPLQYAFAEFLGQQPDLGALRQDMQAKQNLLVEGLKGTPFRLHRSQGTYFQLINYQDVSNEEDRPFAQRLIDEAGVATVPLSYFYHEKNNHRLVRLAFLKKAEDIKQAVARLQAFAS